MERLSPGSSDPSLTANIYCAGFLDQLLWEAVAPLWSRHQATDAKGEDLLWFARYRRGGEHLKIRFHGPPAARDAFKVALATAVQEFLDALPGAAAPQERDCHASQFPIDPEDQCTVAYPDRTILWTSYLREPGIMGRQPMSDDALHAVLFTRCLGIGSDIVLENLRPDAGGTIPGTLRFSMALKFFIAACSSLGLPAEGKVEYLRYHRDWLLTSFDVDLAATCSQFDQRIQKHPETLERLRPLLDSEAGAETEEVGEGDLYCQWQDGFAELFRYGMERAGDPEFLRDPYLKDQVLATPFKLLHAHTNQLATGLLNEGYLCQLLIRACEAIWPETAVEWRS